MDGGKILKFGMKINFWTWGCSLEMVLGKLYQELRTGTKFKTIWFRVNG